MQRLSRRQFMLSAGGLGLLAGCGRLPWQAAASPPRAYRVGWLTASGPDSRGAQAFLSAMHERGYVEGQNLVIEWRPTGGNQERLAAIAAELVELPVDVILTGSTPATEAAKAATSTIPIVFATGGSPVGGGLAASLAQPGGNVTGLTGMTVQLTAKRLELLKGTIPGAARVAVLWNPASTPDVLAWREVQATAPVLGFEPISLEVRHSGDFSDAFGAATTGRAQALFLSADAVLAAGRAPEIIEFATRERLPTMFAWREGVEAGGLMSYGVNLMGQYHRAAYYVDRILKGTKPADLPVEQPMRFEFVVNMRTARALGITFPHEVALQITEVIE